MLSPVTVAVSKAWTDSSERIDIALDRPWQVISPPEPLHALILAVGRDCMDIEKHEVVQRWRRFLLSVPVEIVAIENEMEIYWTHLALRERPGIEYDLVRCSALQRILQINHFACKVPEHGNVTNQKLAKIMVKSYNRLVVAEASEQITQNFIFCSLEVFQRFLSKSAAILQKLHDFTDEFGPKNPLNSVTKLHALVMKAGGGSAGNQRIVWLFELLMDLFRRGSLPEDRLSKGLLLGTSTGDGQRRVGVADVLLTKLDLLNDVLGRVRAYLPQEVFYDLQESCSTVALFRILEQENRVEWPASAIAAAGVIGSLVYDTIWDETILSWLRGRKSRASLWKRKDFEKIVKTLGALRVRSPRKGKETMLLQKMKIYGLGCCQTLLCRTN